MNKWWQLFLFSVRGRRQEGTQDVRVIRQARPNPNRSLPSLDLRRVNTPCGTSLGTHILRRVLFGSRVKGGLSSEIKGAKLKSMSHF